jgi:hypothetical protein
MAGSRACPFGASEATISRSKESLRVKSVRQLEPQ